MRVDKSLFTSLYIDNEQALYKYGNSKGSDYCDSSEFNYYIIIGFVTGIEDIYNISMYLYI